MLVHIHKCTHTHARTQTNTHSASAHGAGRRRSVCGEKSEGLIGRRKDLRMLSPDARLYVELARCHCYHSIYLFVSNLATNVFSARFVFL